MLLLTRPIRLLSLASYLSSFAMIPIESRGKRRLWREAVVVAEDVVTIGSPCFFLTAGVIFFSLTLSHSVLVVALAIVRW